LKHKLTYKIYFRNVNEFDLCVIQVSLEIHSVNLRIDLLLEFIISLISHSFYDFRIRSIVKLSFMNEFECLQSHSCQDDEQQIPQKHHHKNQQLIHLCFGYICHTFHTVKTRFDLFVDTDSYQ